MRCSAVALLLKYLNREGRVVMMAFGFLAALVTSPMFFVTRSSVAQAWEMLVDGETVQARVTVKTQAARAVGPPFAMAPVIALGGSRPANPDPGVKYVFVDRDGHTHSGGGTLPGTLWRQLSVGDEVSVRYLPGNPAVNQLNYSRWDALLLIPFALLSPCILLVSLVYGMRGVAWALRQVRLVRHGAAVAGRVIRAEVVVSRGPRGRSNTTSVIEYADLATGSLTGRLELQGRLPHPWTAGGGIVVLVDPQSPSSHTVDLFDARHADRLRLFGAI